MNYLENFNKTLEELLDNLKKNNYLDSKIEYSIEGEKNIKEFITNTNNKGFDISTKNEIIFSKNIRLLNDIDFYKIWNDDNLKDNNKDIIWKYLHTLYLYSYSWETNLSSKEIFDKYKNIDLNNNDLNERTVTVLNILEFFKLDLENKDIDNIIIDEETKSSIPNLGTGGLPNITDLLDGEIGNLAKEIVNDIDPSSLNLDNPDELLKDLMSGNINTDDNGLNNLINKVIGKIENKMTDGSINQDKLFNEANNMMSKLGLSKDMFNSNDFNISEVIKNINIPNTDNEDFQNGNIDINKEFSNILNNINATDINNNSNIVENIDKHFSKKVKNIDIPKKSINKSDQNNRLSLEKRRDYLKKKLEKKKLQAEKIENKKLQD